MVLCSACYDDAATYNLVALFEGMGGFLVGKLSEGGGEEEQGRGRVDFASGKTWGLGILHACNKSAR